MKLQIPAFIKLRKNLNSLLMGNSEVLDCNNVIFEDGKVKKRAGYAQLGSNLPLNGRVSLITEFSKLRVNEKQTICCTEHEVYKFYNGAWIFLTPVYNTGTAAASGTAVTGAGGATWDTGWPASQYYIKFGTNDKNGIGSPDVWFTIASVDSATGITLASTAGTIGAGAYVIRKSFALTVTDDWQVAYVIMPPGGTDELWGIFVNGTEIWYYDGTTFADLAGTTLGAKFIKSYYDHIVIGFVTDGSDSLPQSIYWNERGDPTDWTGGSSGYVDLLQGTGEITGLEVLHQRMYVTKNDSIVEGYYTGDATVPFIFNEDKIYKAGCVNGKTLVNNSKELLFQSADNILSFDGFQVNPIGDEVATDLIQNVNSEYAYKNFAVNIPDKHLYCLFIVTIGYTEPNKVYVFNYLSRVWTIWSMADFMRCVGEYSVTATATWESVANGIKWSDMSGYWNIRSISAGSNNFAFGDSAGYVYRMDFTGTLDDDANIDCFIETKDYEAYDSEGQPKADTAMKLLRTLLTMESYLGDIRVRYSTDFGVSWSTPIDFTQSVPVRHYFQRWLGRGNQIRFRIENIDNSRFDIINMMIEYNESGRIN
jgi:hypothetical protein